MGKKDAFTSSVHVLRSETMATFWFSIVFLTFLLALSEHGLAEDLDQEDATKPCAVKTLKDKCCVFPFRYRGKTYSSCTFVKSTYKWCSLTADYDKDKKWGYCKEKCTTVITQKGQCCVFPFIYRGQTYYNCTFKNFKKKWCSLTPNYDVDKRWGYCANNGWRR